MEGKTNTGASLPFRLELCGLGWGSPGQLYFKIEKAHLPQELALPPVSDGDSQVQHVGRWIETHASQRQLNTPSSNPANPARQEGSKAAHGQAVINLWSPVIPMKTLCILICPVEINQSWISVAGVLGWLCFFIRTQGSVYMDGSIVRFSVSSAREDSELTFVSPLSQSILDKSTSFVIMLKFTNTTVGTEKPVGGGADHPDVCLWKPGWKMSWRQPEVWLHFWKLGFLLVVETVSLFVHWMLKKQVCQRGPCANSFQSAELFLTPPPLGIENIQQTWIRDVWLFCVYSRDLRPGQALGHLLSMWPTRPPLCTWFSGPQLSMDAKCVDFVGVWMRGWGAGPWSFILDTLLCKVAIFGSKVVHSYLPLTKWAD